MEGKFKSRVGRPLPPSIGRPVGVMPVTDSPLRMKKTFQRSGSHKPVILGRGSDGLGSRAPRAATAENQYSNRSPNDATPNEFIDDGIKFIDVQSTAKPVKPSPVLPDGTRINKLSNRNRHSNYGRTGTYETDDRSKSSKTSARVSKSRPESSSSTKSFVPSSHGASRPSSKTNPRAGSSRSERDLSPETEAHINTAKTRKTIDFKEILEKSMESDFDKIYDINLHASEITHIANLDKFSKVRVLDLSCNYIERIENLEINTDLRELKLYDNRLRAVERLKTCKELCSLQLQHNQIKQIGKGLSGLSKLKTLRIDCNQILKLEVSELSCCPQLTVVDISYNVIDNLAAINYLPNLEELYAAGNRLRSVDLSRCKRLTEVDVSQNRVTDLSGLKGLPNLQIINASSNSLFTLKSLGKSKSIQELHVSRNKLSELSYFSTYFPRLEILNVSCNSIKDFDEVLTLSDLEEFAELFIAGNPFSDQGSDHQYYMTDIQSYLPKLEILDGAHIKRQTQKGAPLMRPMSASTIISTRQVETMMQASENEMKSFEKSIMDKFESLREVYETLPDESPSQTSARDVRRSSSRLKQALTFAAHNTDDV